MKILLLGRYTENEALSGPEKFSKRLLSYLHEKNLNIIFIDYYFKDRSDANFLNRLFGKKLLKSEPLVLRLGIFRIFGILCKTKPDVIHIVNLERFQIPIYLFKKLLRLRVLTTFHGSLVYEIQHSKYNYSVLQKLKIHILERLALNKSDIRIFVSNLLKNWFEQKYQINDQKNFVIYSGIDPEFIVERRIEFNEPFKFVFYNGNAQYLDRGLNFVFETLQEIDKFQIELFVVGEQISNFAGSEKLKVFWSKIFKRKDLINFLMDKHFIIKGPVVDSFSIFVGECMSLGIIPIIHKKVGISEFIKDGVNGFLYPIEDNREVKMIIKKILGMKNNLKEVSENCRKTALQLQWPEQLKEYEKVYASIIRKKN
ncbi:MAG: glycosyltransferase family 4 protein [Ignavibacteria bacterium]